MFVMYNVQRTMYMSDEQNRHPHGKTIGIKWIMCQVSENPDNRKCKIDIIEGWRGI